ncbi:MAG: hypothetical protein JKX85_09620 [Phycisphaeraceae bacterium]|nr:hypothetical protein [Phycisphaeraceae bacterium]
MLAKSEGIRQKFDKPMLSNETIPGCLDDAKRAQCAKWTIPMMEDAEVTDGWGGACVRDVLFPHAATVSTRTAWTIKGFMRGLRVMGTYGPGWNF